MVLLYYRLLVKPCATGCGIVISLLALIYKVLILNLTFPSPFQICVGPSKSQHSVSDSRFKFILGSTLFSPVVFSIMHAILLVSFNDDHKNKVLNVNWKSSYLHPDRPEDLRVLNEVIGSLLLCGVISISLLLASRYSKLESDRSRFQIYKNIKKEYAAFRAAELVDNWDILDFFKDEQVPEEDEDKKLFNFLFSMDQTECLKQCPVKFLKFDEVNSDKKGDTLLTKAVKITKNRNALKKVLEIEQIDVNKKDRRGKTPLSCAIECENIEAVEILLAHPNIEVNKFFYLGDKKEQKFCSPLLLAVEKESCDIVEILLKHKHINVNVLPFQGENFTPLTKAIYLDNEKIVKLLLSHESILVNKMDSHGWTPLSQARSRRNENHHSFNWFRPVRNWPILELILQRTDLDVDPAELPDLRQDSVKTNLSFKQFQAYGNIIKIPVGILCLAIGALCDYALIFSGIPVPVITLLILICLLFLF